MGRLDNYRIARVATVPFSIATQANLQFETFAEAGAFVTIVTSRGPSLERIGFSDRLVFEEIEIPREIRPLADIAALWNLYRFFRRSAFDIVHSTTPKAGLLCAIAGFFAGVPVRFHTFTGQRWVTLSGAKRAFLKALDRLVVRLNTHSFTDSPSQRQFLIDVGVAPPDRVSVIGYGSLAGIDIVRFRAGHFSPEQRRSLLAELGIDPDSRIFLFIGRVCRDKGVVELLQAFRQVLSTGHGASLVLVGPLDEPDPSGRAELEKLIEGCPAIHSVGYVDQPETFLDLSYVLCLPSYREGFGTVVLEAASMGVPTIGSDIYGLSDAIVDGETGILVPARDTSALSGAMARLLEDTLMRDRMGQQALERCHRDFSSSNVSDGYIDAYTKWRGK